MSTISSGEAKRSFISGTRLWPPASTFASSPPSRSRLIASPSDRGASYRNRDGYIRSSVSCLDAEPQSALRERPGPGVAARPGGLRVGNRDGKRVLFRVRPRFLMRRPWPGHRLPGDLEVVHQLRPGPDGRALAGLRRVLDKLVQARIALAVPAGLDPHDACSCLRRHRLAVFLYPP